MAKYDTDCLVILAGGQSRRMGRDKALVEIQGKRMIDHMIDRFSACDLPIIISGPQDYSTGLEFVPDNPKAPYGPVGAIFSLSLYFLDRNPPVRGFYTVPVDAPYAPLDLIEKLEAHQSCTVASSNNQLHPVFAYWDCTTVKSIEVNQKAGSNNPSLQWLARQCGAKTVDWADHSSFTNINTPEQLKDANK
ncbi:MAG: molybdenum cofactor guanylyltransferase MobA [Parasphingorhabdus sp.]